MKHLSLLFILLSVASPAALHAAERSKTQRPNIVMVLIDDMGWGDLSCFGNTSAKTPHIDALASEGLRFTQFYVNAPICSPSRCALTTGQYPHRWRITSFLEHRKSNERRGMAHWLDPQAPVLARFLNESGYATGHFGKWHLGGQRDVGDAPLISEYGFDESLTNFEGLGPRLLGLGTNPSGQPTRIAFNSDTLGRGPVIWHNRAKLTEGYVGAAITFLDRAAASNRPFYINLWPDDVHAPFFPLQQNHGNGKRARFRDVLESMDAQLGVLLDHIRSSPALRDNTLILLCSDNGPAPDAGSAGPFRAGKATLFEGGIRSPLIAWGPKLISPDSQGKQNDTSVFAAFDLVPSLLAIASVKPADGVTFDGEPLGDVLLGKSTASRQKPIFWRRPPDRKSTPAVTPEKNPDLAVRAGDWKLLCEYNGTLASLYDLATDRGETTNLAQQHPDIVARLTESVLAWHRALPPDNGPALAQ